jgi:multicomponent Na+:H+ antiporter subunit G
VADAVAGVLLVAGLGFVLLGVVGVLRLPDFYSRLHATSKVETLGLALMASGVAVQAGLTLLALKILLIIPFVAFVNSTAAHALGRAAHRSGLPCWTARDGDQP